MESFVFRFKFCWGLFLSFNWQYVGIGSGNDLIGLTDGLTLDHMQLITWRNKVNILVFDGLICIIFMYWFVLFRYYDCMPLPLTQITYTYSNI